MKKIFLNIESIIDSKYLYSKKNNLSISWADFIKIESEVKEMINQIIANNKNDIYKQLLIINYKIFIDLSNIYYYLKLTKGHNADEIYYKNSTYFSDFIELTHPTNFATRPINFEKFRLKKSLRFLYKWLKLFYLSNTFSSIFFKKKKFVLFESDSKHTLEFLKKSKSLVIPLCLSKILSKNFFKIKLPSNQTKVCEDLAELIASSFLDLIGNQITNRNSLANHIKKHYSLIFKKTLTAKIIFDQYLSNKKTIDLYIGSNNNTLLRTFTLSVIRSGGNVSTFTHGEPIIYKWDKISWMELALANNYYEYTGSLAKSMNRVNQKTDLFNLNCNILTFNTNQFIKNWNQNLLTKKNDCDSIMFVANEYVRDGQLSQVSSFTNVIQYEFELKILKFLSNKFKKVYYKRHPGGVFTNKKINFYPKNILIINDAYETVQDLCQTIIFGHSKTTSIGYALSTKKNIILFTGSWEIFEESVLKSLKKQIHILDYIEKDGYLDFNELDLNYAIKNPKKNYSYFKKYLTN